MKVHYVSCFLANDPADTPPFRDSLRKWTQQNQVHFSDASITKANDLRSHLLQVSLDELDVLIIGAHGDPSLWGFVVGHDKVRWQDLAFLLRGRLPGSCTFVFYSCNGGYPGISHVFGRDSGPDFVFGPRIAVLRAAMENATLVILRWKLEGGGPLDSARQLVDDVNRQAKARFFSDPKHHEFLRVMWCEGPGCRYPNTPGPELPSGPKIELRGWGLDSQ
jgi:hypothetical protein